MNNQEVAHEFIHQSADYRKGSNYWFQGNSLYSYSTEIARIEEIGKKKVVMVCNSYISATTCKHQNYALQAIPKTPDFVVVKSEGNYFSDKAGTVIEKLHKALEAFKELQYVTFDNLFYRFKDFIHYCEESIEISKLFRCDKDVLFSIKTKKELGIIYRFAKIFYPGKANQKAFELQPSTKKSDFRERSCEQLVKLFKLLPKCTRVLVSTSYGSLLYLTKDQEQTLIVDPLKRIWEKKRVRHYLREFEKREKIHEDRERARKNREDEERELLKNAIGRFHNFETPSIYAASNTYLRYKESSGMIETSKGMKISYTAFLCLYNGWKACPSKLIGRVVLKHFKVDGATKERVIIGCHDIPASEIERAHQDTTESKENGLSKSHV